MTDSNNPQSGPLPVSTIPKRERSSIAFPYQNLGDAIEAARAVYEHVATGSCEEAQLAAWLNQSPSSSAFRVRVATTRLFGLFDSGKAIRCTELGLRIVDPKQERAARIDAFLRVPLFAMLYERFKSTILPTQASALEAEIVSLGVAEKQKERARQIFSKSAELAGFFEQGKERLVKPGVMSPTAGQHRLVEDAGDRHSLTAQNGLSAPDNLNLDPLLMALLQKIPTVFEGWPTPRRLRWFRTFAMNVAEIYDSEEESMEIKIELVPRL